MSTSLDWTIRTPDTSGDDSGFQLWAYNDGECVQSIDDLTRSEYVRLKEAIAAGRRLPFTDPEGTAPPPTASESIEWNEGTPADPTRYQLGMFVDCFSEQIEDLNRTEFIALKARLAELRGLPFSDEEMDEETSTAARPAAEPPVDRRTEGEPAWKFDTRVHKLLREYLADIDRYLLAHWRSELERDVDAPNQLAADITLLRNIAFAYHLADGLEFPGLKLLSAIEDHVEPQTMRPR